MRLYTRRTFLAVSSLAALAAAPKRSSSVLADLGGSTDVDPLLLKAIREAGFAGCIRDAPDAGLKLKPQDNGGLQLFAIRAALPRFEDSMDDAAASAKTLAGLASAQGASAVIATHPGLSGNGAFRPVDLERKAHMLDIAGAICAASGLTFLYQNQSLEFTGNAAEERGLITLTDTKKTSYLVDTGEAMRAGADIAAFFETNAKRIAGFQLSDFDGDGLVPLGQGKLPAAALAAAIQKSRWTGLFIAPFNLEKNPKAARDLIRAKFNV